MSQSEKDHDKVNLSRIFASIRISLESKLQFGKNKISIKKKIRFRTYTGFSRTLMN
jgi:hypothetical protein